MIDPSAAAGHFQWWVPLGAVLIACLYLPSLTTRFDFNDDGCLAYPAPGLTPGHCSWKSARHASRVEAIFTSADLHGSLNSWKWAAVHSARFPPDFDALQNAVISRLQAWIAGTY